MGQWYDRAEEQEKAKRQEELAAAKDRRHIEKSNKDSAFRYHIAKVEETEPEEAAAPGRDDFVLGIRPEFLSLREDGPIEGEIFSAMPTGMETTVRIRIGDYLLTGVVFGGVLYKIGQKVRLGFPGDCVALFSRKNGRMIGRGSLEIKG